MQCAAFYCHCRLTDQKEEQSRSGLDPVLTGPAIDLLPIVCTARVLWVDLVLAGTVFAMLLTIRRNHAMGPLFSLKGGSRRSSRCRGFAETEVRDAREITEPGD